jgi:hypothetical protein
MGDKCKKCGQTKDVCLVAVDGVGIVYLCQACLDKFIKAAIEAFEEVTK